MTHQYKATTRKVAEIALISILLVFIVLPGMASAAWWNGSWASKSPIPINNTGNATTLTNFSVNLYVPYNSNMNLNFSDLRVVNDTAGTNVSYWIESQVNGSYANIWFNATKIPASAWTNSTYYLYYNNPSAVSASNGTTTFLQWHGAASSQFVDSATQTIPYIYESKARITSDPATNQVYFGVSNIQDFAVGASDSVAIVGSTKTNFKISASSRKVGVQTGDLFSPNWNQNQYYRIKIVANSTSRVDYYGYDPFTLTDTITTNNPTLAGGLAYYALSGTGDQEFSFIRKQANPDPTAQLGMQELYFNRYNNYTYSGIDNFSILSGKTVNFSINTTEPIVSWAWYFNGTNQANNKSYLISTLPSVAGTVNLSVVGNLSGGVQYLNRWNVTTLNYAMELLTPINNSVGVSISPTLTWREWQTTNPHTYQVSTDNQFINIIASGTATSTTENYSVGVNLNPNTVYYWQVKHSGGVYSPYFQFNTGSITGINGSLNITAFDEQQTNNRIMTFYVQVYNNTALLNRSTVNGWVNFSSAEVSAGEYFIHLIPNSSFSSRSQLATSPANVTFYVPATALPNTIDNVAFYLYDFIGKFPWQTSKFYIYKNNTLMHSSYFDAEAKVLVSLIQGDTYSISVINGADVWNYGNFIPIQTGSVKLAINNFGINQSNYLPFNYNLTWTNSDIILKWSSAANVLNSLNFTIYKGSAKVQVHNLITSVPNGISGYSVTNTSDIYYVYIAANTTNNPSAQYVQVIDYRAGNRNALSSEIPGIKWNYGSFVMPDWGYDAVSFTLIGLVGGTFGAYTAAIGAPITILFALILAYFGWLPGFHPGIPVLGGLLIYAVLYYMKTHEKMG